MRFLLVDNFDSFTYNIVYYLEQCGVLVEVESNLSVELKQIEKYDAVILSPGPGLPKESGKLMDVISEAIQQQKPILGICLGMQALAEWEGSELINQRAVKHGVAEKLSIEPIHSPFYKDVRSNCSVGLYHSWAVHLKQDSTFVPSAYSENSVLMSFEDRSRFIFAVQFHPESILTEDGLQMIRNFVSIVSTLEK